MTRYLPLAAMCLLIACKQEPSFDERFAEAQKRLEAKSAAIDNELSKAEQDARAAGTVKGQVPHEAKPIEPEATSPAN